MRRTDRKVQLKSKRKLIKNKKVLTHINVDDFEDKYSPALGFCLTELCKMKMLSHKYKEMKYTHTQRWLSTNLYVSCGKKGYETLRTLMKLPAPSTIVKYLANLKGGPGVSRLNAHRLHVKVSPKRDHEKMCWLLLDEMTLKPSLNYDSKTDSIVGFADDGTTRSPTLAKNALVVYVVGITKYWKGPLGYHFDESVVEYEKCKNILLKSIEVLEAEGFEVMGVTTDQGSNFESMFKRCFEVSENNPFFTVGSHAYFVCRDAPHLIKSARNYLLHGDVKIPGCKHMAKWTHITALQEQANACSLNMIPKLRDRMVSNISFKDKMKVKYAVNVLSNTVAATINTLVRQGELSEEVLATAVYCKKLNDIFDLLNSSTLKETVPFRRPLLENSIEIGKLKEALAWLKELQVINSHRPKVKFIKGFIQTINVVLEMRKMFTTKKLKYLHTRRFCQDALELFFGKVRNGISHPSPSNFEAMYHKIASASVVRAPNTGNCEKIEEDVRRSEISALFKDVSEILWSLSLYIFVIFMHMEIQSYGVFMFKIFMLYILSHFSIFRLSLCFVTGLREACDHSDDA